MTTADGRLIVAGAVWMVGVLSLAACAGNPRSSPPPVAAGAVLRAGLRSSPYGPKPTFPVPEHWAYAAKSMASRYKGGVPATVWIVGTMAGSAGQTRLSFPSPGGAFANVVFAEADRNEPYLDLFDRVGVKVWLQVEPADADLETLIDLVLGRYQSHPCVVGFGVDVEWFRYSKQTNPEGAAVSDELARAWSERVRAHKTGYRLFLKHWLVAKMPPTYREGLMFLDDSQEFTALEPMVAEFAEWGRAFAPAPVGFQYGYRADRAWWRPLGDPPADIGRAILARVPNTSDLYWVDFTMDEIWPRTPAGNPPAF